MEIHIRTMARRGLALTFTIAVFVLTSVGTAVGRPLEDGGVGGLVGGAPSGAGVRTVTRTISEGVPTIAAVTLAIAVGLVAAAGTALLATRQRRRHAPA